MMLLHVRHPNKKFKQKSFDWYFKWKSCCSKYESRDLYDKDDLRDDDGYLFFDSDAFYKSPESYWNSLIEQEEPKDILTAIVNNIDDSY